MSDIAIGREKSLKEVGEKKAEERQQKPLKLQEKWKSRVEAEANNSEKTVNLGVRH